MSSKAPEKQTRNQPDSSYSTRVIEWRGAGRPPGHGRYTWYMPEWLRSCGEDQPLDAFLEDCYQRNHFRRQLDTPPGDDGLIPYDATLHYIAQRGAPRAFTYAVGLGTGIKVGISGTGDGDLVTQLTGRFGTYKSTHAVDVIGVRDHLLEETNKAEAELLRQLAEFKLDFGEEIFQDCPQVREILWKWFGPAWHQPKLLATLEERAAYWKDIASGSDFHNLEGKSHTHAFAWRDYVRLVEEIELCQMAVALWANEASPEWIVQQHREENCLPAFGESEDDDLLLELLKIYLPKEEARYPNARKKLHAHMGWP